MIRETTIETASGHSFRFVAETGGDLRVINDKSTGDMTVQLHGVLVIYRDGVRVGRMEEGTLNVLDPRTNEPVVGRDGETIVKMGESAFDYASIRFSMKERDMIIGHFGLDPRETAIEKTYGCAFVSDGGTMNICDTPQPMVIHSERGEIVIRGLGGAYVVISGVRYSMENVELRDRIHDAASHNDD